MSSYEDKIKHDLIFWKVKMLKDPLQTEHIAHFVQSKTRDLIPTAANRIITDAIKTMTKFILSGSDIVTNRYAQSLTLRQRDRIISEKINGYKKAGIFSGAFTGYGGFLLGAVDFPVLLSIKMKMLSEISACYGFDPGDPKERLYMLTIFQLTFSRREKRKEIFHRILNWQQYAAQLPEDVNAYDWTSFREEYCDYIDLAKLMQMIPGIGALFGAYANNKLIAQLAENAMQAYHYRFLSQD